MIAQQWRQFGIDAKTDVAQGTHGRPPRRRRLRRHDHAGASRPGAAIPTCRSSSTAGTRSSSPRPASRSRRATGSAGRNPELDKIIEQIRTIGFDDPKGLELGRDYVKLVVQRDADHSADVLQRLHGDGRDLLDRLPERRDRPYTDPVPNWGNSQVHDGEAEAREVDGDVTAERGARGSSPPLSLVSRLQRACAPMNAYAIYASKRLGQFALVVFIGINIAFVITHATPIDPVEQTIAAATAVRQHQPRGDRDDAPVAARALRARGQPAGAVRWRSGSASSSAISGPRCRPSRRRSRR